MQLPNRFCRKNLLLTYFTVLCLLTFGILPNITRVQAATTTISVDPLTVTRKPGEGFTVDINVTDVIDLRTWQVNLRWNVGVLEFTNATRGPFLTGLFLYNVDIIKGEVLLSCVLQFGTPASGSGVLVTVGFLVLETGESPLELFDTALIDDSNVRLPHDTVDGYFYTTWPVASFTHTPDTYGRPIVGESVTFNASASYDPDGGSIVSYEWDFGDNVTGTGIIITHTYDAAGDYNVTLTVTDDDAENYTTYARTPTDLLAIKFHDISIMDVEAPAEVLAGDIATIKVTVANNGSHAETFNVTVMLLPYYFDDTYYYPTAKTEIKQQLLPGETFVTEDLEWNTTGFAPGSYAAWAYAYLVDLASLASRPGEEQNTTDNTRFGGTFNVTLKAEHDVAITDVTVAPTNVKVGHTVGIYVRVKNEGNVEETFTVNVYNGTLGPEFDPLIGNQSTTLPAGTEETVYLSFPPFDPATIETAVPATYNVSAKVPPIINPPPDTNETDVADNTFANVTGTIRLLPVANFTFSPSEPVINQTVTFNASDSYTPGIPTRDIVSYSWDFGDGTTSTGNITTHAYAEAGSYTVRLTVVDSDGLSDTFRDTVPVDRLNSTITVSASMTTIPVGSKGMVITGSISPVRAGANVSIYYVKSGEKTWISLANMITGANGQYLYSWTVWLQPGNYTVKANWPGDEVTLPAESSEITMKVVQKTPSTIDVSVSSTTITLGESIDINGSISPALPGVNVTIWLMLSGSEWSTLATVTTDENGRYTHHDWDPAVSGTYVLKASWPGDTVTNADESDVQVIVVEEVAAPDIFLYSTVGLAVALAAIIVYFVWVKKPKIAK